MTKRYFSPLTYVLLFVYTLIAIGSVYLLVTDDYSHMISMSFLSDSLMSTTHEVNGTESTDSSTSFMVYIAQALMSLDSIRGGGGGGGGGGSDIAAGDGGRFPMHPIAHSRAHLELVRPALDEARKSLASQPLHTATFVGVVFALTWLVMRIALRMLLSHLVKRFNLHSNSRFGIVASMLGIDSTMGGVHRVSRIIEFGNPSKEGMQPQPQQDEQHDERHEGDYDRSDCRVYSMLTKRIPDSPVVEGVSKKTKMKRDRATNYVSSTVFDSSSKTVVALLSFIYGGLVYLSQKMQVWCLAIALVQWLSFNTGKSFWPLIIFTIFTAIVFARGETSAWRADQKNNSNQVRLAARPIRSTLDTVDVIQEVSESLGKSDAGEPHAASGANGSSVHKKNDNENVQVKTIARGKLRPGDWIEIRVGEQIPADIIIVGARVDAPEQPKRILFFMNEVQVTGENTPVRKIPFSCPDGSDIHKIEITDLETYEAVVNDKYFVEPYQIAFGSSVLEAERDDIVVTGIVAWVGTETKALNNSSSSSSGVRHRRATPFDEYSGRGFFLSVFVLLTISLFNAVVAYFSDPDHDVHFGAVFVNHLMYINMIVPQALEQCRTWVSYTLSNTFRAEIKGCNKSSGLDVLGYIDRIVSDKTGTLTQNKMLARACIIFKEMDPHDTTHIANPLLMFNSDDNGHINDSNTREHRKFFSNPEYASVFEKHALAVFATTGTDPEELAIRRNISAYATLTTFEPPDPNDLTTGDIKFKPRDPEAPERHLIIHVNFGFWRPLLCKTAMFEDTSTGQCYVAVQAGGDEMWHMGDKIRTTVAAKLEICDEREKTFPTFPGAPRAWSHGLRPISRDEMEDLKRQWYESYEIQDMDKRIAEQIEIVRTSLGGDMDLVSKTFMIDEYRTHVDIAIRRLVKEGKQVFMCTGDSRTAAATIAMQLRFPNKCIDIYGTDDEELLESIRSAAVEARETPSTFFIEQNTMEFLQQVEKRDGGFRGVVFEELLGLLEKRQPHRPDRFLHSAVFCRATPGLKPFVVRMLQHAYMSSLIDSVQSKRHYVLAVGDGANDVNMFGVADASLGILSGETLDVCDRATMWTTEWHPVVPLLLEDGPEKATLLATMAKMVFMKHWLTAFALWADLLFGGFVLMPMEPTNPMMMLLFNAVIFTQISTHAARDVLDPSKLRRAKYMSMRALTRWIMSAGVLGFAVCWVVRWLFPYASADQFGHMILVGQSVAITIYVLLSTNTWTDQAKDDSEEPQTPMTPLPRSLGKTQSPAVSPQQQLIRGKRNSTITLASLSSAKSTTAQPSWKAQMAVVIGLICTTGSIALSIYYARRTADPLMRFIGVAAILIIAIYPSLGFYKILNRDLRFLFNLQLRSVLTMDNLVAFTHTKHGRILPLLLFSLALKLVSGISLVAMICIGILTSIASVVIFMVFVSRIGFMRALLDGRAAAVAIIFFGIGVFLGKNL